MTDEFTDEERGLLRKSIYDLTPVELLEIGMLERSLGITPVDTLSIKLARETLDRSPKKNWVENVGGLPAFIVKIAKDLHEERGMTISRAIATAISMCKKWAAGGKNVKPATRAKAAAAIAKWESMKARSKSK
jgi:hypothetical protein